MSEDHLEHLHARSDQLSSDSQLVQRDLRGITGRQNSGSGWTSKHLSQQKTHKSRAERQLSDSGATAESWKSNTKLQRLEMSRLAPTCCAPGEKLRAKLDSGAPDILENKTLFLSLL